MGICGGYQMLGRKVCDPMGIEGEAGETPGLGLLDIETVMSADKSLREVRAQHVATGCEVDGYEIHIGVSDGPDRARPFAMVDGTPEGARSADGLVTGSYLHGMFTQDAFRRAFLEGLGAPPSEARYASRVEQTLDALAAHLETHLDVDGLLGLAR